MNVPDVRVEPALRYERALALSAHEAPAHVQGVDVVQQFSLRRELSLTVRAHEQNVAHWPMAVLYWWDVWRVSRGMGSG